MNWDPAHPTSLFSNPKYAYTYTQAHHLKQISTTTISVYGDSIGRQKDVYEWRILYLNVEKEDGATVTEIRCSAEGQTYSRLQW